MIKLIWSSLIILGILFVILFDQGRGLSSPGILLIPIGIIGGIITRRRQEKLADTKQSHLFKWVLFLWLVALFSLLGLYFGWFTEGFDGFLWIIPSAISVLLGLILTTVYIFKR